MTSAALTPGEAAAAIVALVNANPRSPRADEIEAVIARVASPLQDECLYGHPPGKRVTCAADIEFEPVAGLNGKTLTFDFTNEQFASAFCPMIRLAFLINGYDRHKLRSFVHQLTHDPDDPEAEPLFAMLGAWEDIRDKFSAIAQFAQVAWARTTAVAKALSDDEERGPVEGAPWLTSRSNEAAAAIVTLINTSPSTPSVVEISSVIARATVVPPASPLTLELRRVRPVLHAAVVEECDTEKTPAYEAACAKARCLDEEFAGLCRQVWERPPENCDRDDLAMRCEAALAYSGRNADGKLYGLNSECLDERSMAQLLVAVAAFAGCKLAS